jgi:dihydrofolate reductase
VYSDKKQHMQKINFIASIQLPNRGLGYEGDLLYKISEDLKNLKKLTLDQVTIMGRKTWESLPEKFRPLPNRITIVITSKPGLVAVSETVFTAPNPDAALAFANELFSEKEIWILGGGDVYTSLIDQASLLCLTEVAGTKPADAFFPAFTNYFTEESRTNHRDEKSGVDYSIVIYKRN